MALAGDDKMIRALAADAANRALRVWILPGRPGRTDDVLDARALNARGEAAVVDRVAIAMRSLVGLSNVLWVDLSHSRAQCADKNDEHIEQPEGCRRDHEEVDAYGAMHVVAQEGTPSLGAWFRSSRGM